MSSAETQVVPRWEWRTFTHAAPHAADVFDALTPTRVEESDELYLLTPGGDNVKVRDGLMDIKVLRETSAAGLLRLEPVLKAPFPLDAEAVGRVFWSLRQTPPPVPAEGLGLDQLTAAVRETGRVLVLPVHKRRARYTVAGCAAERSVLEAGGHSTTTIAVESTEPADVLAAMDVLGVRDHTNLDVPTGLRLLLGRAPERYAVVDVGTNSVKFRVAELDADGHGPWKSVVDRAVVTRLGEGIEHSGDLGAEPLERTVRAVEEMAAEARGYGARGIAAVATAGARKARNRADLVGALRDRCGLSLAILSGEDEARLAYQAVVAGVGLGEGPMVTFDTGGGSSQFSFGHGSSVDERFSLEVGAVRFTEQFGLANAVSADVVAQARASISTALARLEGRPRPEGAVAMGGAVTNLAAVKHALEDYDSDVVQGTLLDRAEMDRQIELYRGLDTSARREIVGLQPARAEVILAGACIVRTILDKLDLEAVMVSDHGLRHGVLLEHFGPGRPPRA